MSVDTYSLDQSQLQALLILDILVNLLLPVPQLPVPLPVGGGGLCGLWWAGACRCSCCRKRLQVRQS